MPNSSQYQHHQHPIVQTRISLRGKLRIVLTVKEAPQKPVDSFSSYSQEKKEIWVLHQSKKNDVSNPPREKISFMEEWEYIGMMNAQKKEKNLASTLEKHHSPLQQKKQALSHLEEKEKKVSHQKKQRNATPTLIKEFFFIGVTAFGIFLLTFVGFNFSSLSQIAQKHLSPNTFAEQQKLMSGLTENEKTNKILFSSTLPVAGSESTKVVNIPLMDLEVMPPDNRIIIPKIGKNIPIIRLNEKSIQAEDWNQLEKEIQKALQDGVVHYPGTADPGQLGNVFITGHSSYYPWDPGRYKDVFALLHDLNVGDEYTIFYNGKKYNYKIFERKIISPKDVSVLEQPTDKKISTLMTCTPIGTALNRLILTAKQE